MGKIAETPLLLCVKCTRSYGTVTSGIEKFGEVQGFPSNAMKHTAYIESGNSGEAVFNETMKLTGIIPGGVYNIDGNGLKYGVLIPTGELKLCLDEWHEQ